MEPDESQEGPPQPRAASRSGRCLIPQQCFSCGGSNKTFPHVQNKNRSNGVMLSTKSAPAPLSRYYRRLRYLSQIGKWDGDDVWGVGVIGRHRGRWVGHGRHSGRWVGRGSDGRHMGRSVGRGIDGRYR